MPRSGPKRTSTLGTVEARGKHFRAYYSHKGLKHTPGHTFHTFALADQWLAAEQMLIARDEWTPPAQRREAQEAENNRASLTLDTYAREWIKNRRVKGRELRPRTAEHYLKLLDGWLAPLAARPIVEITKPDVNTWYLALPDKPTMKKHAYDFLRSVMATATKDELIEKNPVSITGASSKPRAAKITLATAEEVAAIADAMPPAHRLAVLLAAWCGLRFGETVALRRTDIEETPTGYVLHISRGVVRVGNQYQEGPTKTDAGERDIIVPPNVVPELRHHLTHHAQWGKDGLLFVSTVPGGGYLTEGQLMGHAPKLNKKGEVIEQGNGFRRARYEAGRPDLSFHKLRHFAATNYAIAGATTKELMEALGHSDFQTALRYQHSAQSRAEELATRVAAMAEIENYRKDV